MRCLAFVPAPSLAIALALAPVGACAQTGAAASPLTEAHRTDLRCSAAFAIVALEQAGSDMPQGWPPLAVRGKAFFADTGERVMREAGLPREAVRDLIAREVQALQQAADPDAALAALATPCVARLDAAVAPLMQPDLAQCAAILRMAFDEVHAREGMSTAARDLKTLASVLAARQREAILARGGSGGQADRALAQAQETMAVEADKGAGVQHYDIAHCYDLARPDKGSHY